MDQKARRKVLMIAFIYSPLGGSGVQRTLKFSKYLPKCGWQPYIVCSDEPDVFDTGLDSSLLAEIPVEARVWRRRFINPLGFRRRVQKLLGVKPRGEIASQRALAMTGEEVASQRALVMTEMRGLRNVFHTLAGLLAPFEFPPVDAALYWAFAILPGCLRLISREKIDLIFTTSFPYSDHVAGYLLKKLTGKPWVADFRDPWTQNASARNSGWRYRVDQWVEQRILQTADRVIGVTPTYTADLHRLASLRSPEDFVTIENGYDAADYSQEITLPKSLAKTEAEHNRKPGQRVRLAHVGRLYDGTALPFFQALEAIGESAARMQVRFIGGLAPQEQTWLENHPLAAYIQVEPRRSHSEAVQAMQEVDVLLLFVIGGFPKSGHLPGKLFEYLASGTPVLLVGPEGDAADLLQRSGVGCFAPSSDIDGLVKVLSLLAAQPEQFRERYYQPRTQAIANYERRALMQKLAAMFDTLTQSGQE
jgi:glycosyltransferase involved in cell wall biosynthesis